MAKNLPAMQEIQVWFLGREDPLEKGIATHSSIFAWRIPWTEESGEFQSIESHRVGHDWSDLARTINNKRMSHISQFFQTALEDWACWLLWPEMCPSHFDVHSGKQTMIVIPGECSTVSYSLLRLMKLEKQRLRKQTAIPKCLTNFWSNDFSFTNCYLTLLSTQWLYSYFGVKNSRRRNS